MPLGDSLPYPFSQLPLRFDARAGTVEGSLRSERRLSALDGIWLHHDAYRRVLEDGDDPLVYSVESIAPAEGPGALHFGIGRIEPGRIGDEYFMTRGHLHEWRPAAEFYIGLDGEGGMVLQSEVTGQSRLLRLNAGDIVYVPGFTAHRTVNLGDGPLVYAGIYPAMAGHDYGAIARDNFACVVIERAGEAVMVERSSLGT